MNKQFNKFEFTKTDCMPGTPSIMGLHLHYRLWIAELNLDINILRIFDDYLTELSSRKNEPEVKKQTNNFHKQFIDSRREIDEMKHEMHLLKMKMAEYARVGKKPDENTYKEENHEALEQRYLGFRKTFDKLKNDFRDFETTWA